MIKRTLIGDILWGLLFLLVTAFFVMPQTHHVFIQWTFHYPYLMGFVKFAVLATMGELLALRLSDGIWKTPNGVVFKVAVWGIIGVLITYMFSFYSAGVTAMMDQGNLTTGNSLLCTVTTAFLTSVIMNLTFGIVFMAMHRMSDTYIEMRVNHNHPSLKELIQSIHWAGFINFVVFKTIPFFWIPAHTITFSLPPYYRVVAAAYLSIVLGVILVYSDRMNKDKTINVEGIS